jgi:hypothetical protein
MGIKLNTLTMPKKKEPVCCGVLEKMRVHWHLLGDGSRCMPYIWGNCTQVMYRVNHCPSCGKYVRDVILKP